MYLSTHSKLVSVRSVVAGVWSIVCALAIAAPILASQPHHFAAAVIYFFFSSICHQIPARSFFIWGFPLAVCHRCAGIYLGLFLSSLIQNRWIHRSPGIRRVWVLAATLPLLFDVLLPYTRLWTSTYLSRFLTGLLFGILLSSLLVRGITEFLEEAPWRRFAIRNLHLKGGFS